MNRSTEDAPDSLIDIDVVIVNFNGENTLPDTLASLHQLQGVNPRITLMDDGSTDGSLDWVRRTHPQVNILAKPANTRRVNQLRNEGVRATQSDLVFVIDNDVKFDPNCLSQLIRVFDEEPHVGVCVPLVMAWDNPEEIYVAGGMLHYVGATIGPHRGESLRDVQLKRTFSCGGGIALFSREAFEAVGGFDEDYLLAWGDDGELHQRMALAGYQALLEPTAICYHEAKAFSAARQYRAMGQLYNRWLLLLSHYRVSTMLLSLPMLLVYEVVQLAFFCVKRMPWLYVKGTYRAVRGLPLILAKRKQVQALRQTDDVNLLYSGPLLVAQSTLGKLSVMGFAITALSRLFDVYWKLIKPVVR